MSKLSREKGKVGERELRDKLRELFPKLAEDIRRGQQYSGIEGDDVVGVPGIHIECKRTETLRLWPSLEQSNEDADCQEVPIVCHRPNRQPWVVICYLDDLPKLVNTLHGHLQPEDSREDQQCTGSV